MKYKSFAEIIMQKRSGKIQFLFWAAFFATLFSLWIALVFLNLAFSQTPLSHSAIKLLIVLYFLVGSFSLTGLVLATLINNRHYERFFAFIIFLLFLSLLAIRSFAG